MRPPELTPLSAPAETDPGHPDRGLTYWREKIIFAILSVGLALTVLAFIPLIHLAVAEGMWFILILDGFVALGALTTLIFRRLPYNVRAVFTLFLNLALGVYVTAYFGMLSGGPICLFTFAVLCGLLLGWKAAAGALLINALVLLTFGWLAFAGDWGGQFPLFKTVNRGLISWGTFMVMNAATAISVAVLVRGLNDLAGKERSAGERLRWEQEKVNASRESLQQEVEERRRTEEALRESEKRYRLLAENASDVIWMTDRSLKLTYVSPSVERVRGFTPLEVLKQSPSEIMTPASLETVQQAFIEEMNREQSPARDPQRARVMEVEYYCRDGSTVWSEIKVSFIRDETGRAAGFLGVGRDITDRKRAEAEKKALQEKLQQSQKLEAIATLAGGIAHQYNNALTVIMGQLELLEWETADPEVIRGITPLHDSARRMVELTNQLLAYARGGKYHPQVVSLIDMVQGTLPLIKHILPPAVRLETDFRPQSLPVSVDLTQMQMVLSAVLANAAEAVRAGGTIRLAGRDTRIDEAAAPDFPDLEPGPYALLTIADDGKGMGEETRRRIFEPFFSTKFQGRGLGLAAVYGIVHNHGGWIAVDSQPEQGTMVRIYLPVAAETPAPRAASRPAPPAPTPTPDAGTVLIIEDEPMLLEVGRAMVSRLGYRVLEARTGREALEVARTYEGPIDLALLDLILPDLHGREVFPRLREARPHVKVIVCSGYSQEGPAQELLDAGAEGFLQKPFSLAALTALMQTLMKPE